MTAGALDVVLAGVPVRLLPDRAMLLDQGELLIADPHFGKAAVFRRHGIPIPAGGTGHDLARIDRLLTTTGAHTLTILGDFLHGPAAQDDPWLLAFRRWRDRHPDLTIHLLIGNHDRSYGLAGIAADWGLQCQADRVAGPFLLVHEPCAAEGRHVLCGHLHPVHVLRGGGDRLRVPVFWSRPDYTVLPGFGAFTGGQPVAPGDGDRLYAAGDEAVVDLGAALRRGGRRRPGA